MPKCLILIALSASLSLPSVQVHALTPRDAVNVALDDIDQIAKEDQPFIRYLYLPGARTAGYAFEFYPALRLHVNLISRESYLAYPKQIESGVWRVDIRDYQWDSQVWEKLADIDPYFHRNDFKDITETKLVDDYVHQWWPGGFWHEDRTYYPPNSFQYYQKKQVEKTITKRVFTRTLYAPNSAGTLASLSLLTQSRAPIVRADWFLVQGARQISLNNQRTGVGYYDWLQLKSRQDYFDLIGLNDKQAKRSEQIIRAIVNVSGVTQHNRIIERKGATTGPEWTTFETDNQSGAGIAIQNLRQGEFLEVAEEHYGFLPNGLPITVLSNAVGVLQDSVPDTIAGNKSALNVSNDTRVHVNIACWQCHAGAVLQPIEEEVRLVYTGRLNNVSFSKDTQLELKRQYGPSLERVLSRDRDEFQNWITAATDGLKPTDAAANYSRAFTRYQVTPVTVVQAAKEVGLHPDNFIKALQDAASRLGRSDFKFDPFLQVPPRPIPRLTFEDGFQDLQDVAYGILREQPSFIPQQQNLDTPKKTPKPMRGEKP